MERNLLLIALPRAAMCMQFPAQGVGEGGSNVLRRNQKQLGAGIWPLLHSTPPLPPGAHTSAQGIECREPSPACQSQGAARGAPRVTAGSGLCAWAPCQAELLPGGGLGWETAPCQRRFHRNLSPPTKTAFFLLSPPLTATRTERAAHAQRRNSGQALLRVP